MALFHFHVTQVKRSAGQSAVAAAAYRAGERLFSKYYGEVSDFTRKGGVVCSEILLPPHAPAEYADRQTLWNAVEKVEQHPKAQLAYSFDFALQNEFSMEENIALARQFLLDEFVSRGMIVDFAVHQPDREEDGIPNPHVHAMCPIRPLDTHGRWGAKQHRVYELDKNGNRIRDEAGNYVFNAVHTTDWGDSKTLEHWREEWANRCNAKFEEKGLDVRVDHRSNERRGIDQLPTVHEGPAVRQMEAKGIRTNKGDLNRWIKKANGLLRDMRKKIAALTDWLKAAKAELNKPQAPALADLLNTYYAARNAEAWSSKAKVGNLKQFSEAINYLTEHGLISLEDLEAHLAAHSERTEAVNTSMKAMSARRKELEDLLHYANLYQETKPIYDEWKGIRWKGKREKFGAEHERDLKAFHMARRKLEKHLSPAGMIPVQAWQKELAALQQKYKAEYEKYKPMRDDLTMLLRVKNCVDAVLHQEWAQGKHRETER